jgi:hypothetical protein
MSFVKLATACGLAAVATGLSGCGIEAKPLAGTQHLDTARGNHAYVDDPRVSHLACLRRHGFSYRLYRTRSSSLPGDQLPAIQIGTPPNGPTVVFYATPGGAEEKQIDAEVFGGEVIGSAILFPNHATDGQLNKIEPCIALGVQG